MKLLVMACLLLIGFAIAPVISPSEVSIPGDDVFGILADRSDNDIDAQRDDDDAGDDGDDGDDDEMNLSIEDLPASVRKTAEAAVPGIVLSGAALEDEDGTTIYEIHGTADGIAWCIEVSTDGKLIEVEEDD